MLINLTCKQNKMGFFVLFASNFSLQPKEQSENERRTLLLSPIHTVAYAKAGSNHHVKVQ
jgi:hypothetical protein